MSGRTRLILIKILHTIVWTFFNVVIAYMGFAVVSNNIDKWFWTGLAAFFIEGIVLLLFRNTCPLTIMARRYSDSQKNNFDIYIPEWLAKYNKTIYSSLLGLVILVLIYRLLTD